MEAMNDTDIQLDTITNADTSSLIQESNPMKTVELPSTTIITMDPNVSDNKENLSKTVNKKKTVANISFSELSRRLTMRKKLHKKLTLVTDIMCFLGMLGIILMIIENEITFAHIGNPETVVSWSIKIVISLSTVVLIGCIIEYHRLDIYLYAVNNSIENHRVAITYTRICLIVIEILICAIHPMPRAYPYHSNESSENTSSDGSTRITDSLYYASVDVALGLPMFARLYLLWRFIMFHSNLFRDASSRSVGFLNKVSIDYYFLIKAYLEQWPMFCLTIFCILVFLIGSWSLRACDYTGTDEHFTMQNAMWLFIITFTTVGYGDFTPSTFCGRTIAAMIGLVGVLSTALLISVLTQKLQMNRWEKYVHNFVLNIELAKERKIQAANVIKSACRLWFIRRKNTPVSSTRFVRVQRDLFHSIHLLHEIKQRQGELVDNCTDQIDLLAIQRNNNTQTCEIAEQLQTMKVKMDSMDERLVEMNRNINNTIADMQETLCLLLKKVSK
ncbi:unnamed protein product [Rotaria sp. Silwood2]|nr:unnamed protein product [Rotaria sp. Silwood2]CAF3384213.1 unnamed protein product [Rotaria sp. Silwood2]CAF4047276.1 unnamed protein product [Rotaria sp. Silwood2]CAF4327157.1 unnamed protein product [Rotaria sp. Silwood2]